MNIYTRQIMALLKIDSWTAIKVQDAMQLDFSEASTRAFNKAAKEAYARISRL
jgi:hypothetical protein